MQLIHTVDVEILKQDAHPKCFVMRRRFFFASKDERDAFMAHCDANETMRLVAYGCDHIMTATEAIQDSAK